MKEAIEFLRKKGLLAEDKTQFVIRRSDGTEMCELSELLTEFRRADVSGSLPPDSEDDIWDDVQAIIEYTHDVDAIIQELKKHFVVGRQ